MGLFRRRSKSQQPFVLDPFLGDPAARALHAALTARDWPTARTILSAASGHAERNFLLWHASEVPGVEEWISRAEPGSNLALVVEGIRAISWAWEARGTAYANQTSQEQFHLFFRRLKTAEDCLDEAVDRDPNDAAAWSALVTLAMARSADRAEAERRFARAVAADPERRAGHSAMLTYLCQKWKGSHEEMFAFARESAARNPSLHDLIPKAHIERWLADDGDDHFASPDVQAELRAAANQTIMSPSFRPSPLNAVSLNDFAMAFALADDHVYGRRAFDLIGNLVTEGPWYFLNGTPAENFTRFKARATA
ncbi:hypothetical protein GCM10027589_29230 [Actinocorallia lasiicapitis]